MRWPGPASPRQAAIHSHSIVNERSKLLIYKESQVAIKVFTVRLTVSSV